jgi:hypothetical protein
MKLFSDRPVGKAEEGGVVRHRFLQQNLIDDLGKVWRRGFKLSLLMHTPHIKDELNTAQIWVGLCTIYNCLMKVISNVAHHKSPPQPEGCYQRMHQPEDHSNQITKHFQQLF